MTPAKPECRVEVTGEVMTLLAEAEQPVTLQHHVTAMQSVRRAMSSPAFNAEGPPKMRLDFRYDELTILMLAYERELVGMVARLAALERPQAA